MLIRSSMHAKKIACFLSILLILSGLMSNANALSTSTVSFHGVGVTIELEFPEEALPGEIIWHNATISANSSLFIRNLTVVIKALVNSSWQEFPPYIDDQYPRFIPADSSYQWFSGPIPLPEETNGKMHCYIYLNTSQSNDYLDGSFFTTLVSKPTFSEIWINYTVLKNDYDSLLANYSSLFSNYAALDIEHNQLTTDYNNKVAAYALLLSQYNKLSDDNNALYDNYESKLAELGTLQTDYENLNSTHSDIQESYDLLQALYNGLNQTYNELETDLTTFQQRINDLVSELDISRIVMFIFTVAVAVLIAFIIYLKRKTEEPYVVIRKETVSMKSNEES